MRKLFPKKYMYKKGKVPTPFPILVDGERTVSKGLGIFSTDWNGSKIEQNIPTVFILDKKGTVQFKYISQNTFDRPGAEYLMKFIKAGKISDKVIINFSDDYPLRLDFPGEKMGLGFVLAPRVEND